MYKIQSSFKSKDHLKSPLRAVSWLPHRYLNTQWTLSLRLSSRIEKLLKRHNEWCNRVVYDICNQITKSKWYKCNPLPTQTWPGVRVSDVTTENLLLWKWPKIMQIHCEAEDMILDMKSVLINTAANPMAINWNPQCWVRYLLVLICCCTFILPALPLSFDPFPQPYLQ